MGCKGFVMPGGVWPNPPRQKTGHANNGVPSFNAVPSEPAAELRVRRRR
jgi:hypothetical protein